MQKIFGVSALTLALLAGGLVDAAAAPAAPIKFAGIAPSHIETVAHRVVHRKRRVARRRHGDDAAVGALFGAIIGGILANPCTFGRCDGGPDDGYYDDGDNRGYRRHRDWSRQGNGGNGQPNRYPGVGARPVSQGRPAALNRGGGNPGPSGGGARPDRGAHVTRTVP